MGKCNQAWNLLKGAYTHLRANNMTPELREKLLAGLKDGSIIPYLGPGVLADVKNAATGAPIPADSDSLIYAMNDGKPMAAKLMYEFPRAAMNVELKRGRSAVTKFLNRTYGETTWTRGAVHDWIKAIAPYYVIDINRDTQLQKLSSNGGISTILFALIRIETRICPNRFAILTPITIQRPTW